MNIFNKTTRAWILIMLVACISGCDVQPSAQNKTHTASNSTVQKMNILIILGSTRHGRLSPALGELIRVLASKRTDITIEVIDLNIFNLPFLDDEVSPASRKVITDPLVQAWSDKIKTGDAFIIVTPVYNAGYPGALKNALDSLYHEWNGKPVGFIGYSGGPSGGSEAIAQLRQVTGHGLEMIPVAQEIKIPTSWKALNTRGNFVDANTIEQQLNTMIDQLIAARPASQK